MKTFFSSVRGRTKLELIGETDKERALLSDLFMPTRMEKQNSIKVRFTTIRNTPKNKDEAQGITIEQVEYINQNALIKAGFEMQIDFKKGIIFKKATTVVILSGTSKLFTNVASVTVSDADDRSYELVPVQGKTMRRYWLQTMAEFERIINGEA